MDFEIFKMDNCDISGYVCHFRHEDRFCNITGFVTKDSKGKLHVFISKKSTFNEYNVKEAVINEVQKH